MFYLDTSVLVAALLPEQSSERVLSWFAERASDKLAISEWAITEMSSALGLKLRTQKIDASERALALTQFNQMTAKNLAVLTVRSAHFRTAAKFADHPQQALRGGDALHLAVASDAGFTVATLDRRLANAGPVLGIPTLLIA